MGLLCTTLAPWIGTTANQPTQFPSHYRKSRSLTCREHIYKLDLISFDYYKRAGRLLGEPSIFEKSSDNEDDGDEDIEIFIHTMIRESGRDWFLIGCLVARVTTDCSAPTLHCKNTHTTHTNTCTHTHTLYTYKYTSPCTQYIQIQESLHINTQIHSQRYKKIIRYRDNDKKCLHTLSVYYAKPVPKWICLNPCFTQMKLHLSKF